MFSDDRSNTISKQALNFPVGLLINSPKRRLAKLGRKPSNGSVQSSSSDTNTGSNESTGVRQPAKNKIRRHNNRLSTVFSRSPHLKDNQSDEDSTVADGMHLTDDPSELSMQLSAPGVLKIFGSEISTGANYKSVLATSHSSAQELVKEALERYSLDKAEAGAYVLCDVIGRLGEEHQWKTECFRVVGDNEKPLMLQSLWKPKEGFCRRFEIQRKSSVEKKTAKEKDTVTAGINAQARKLQKIRSRGASVFIEEDLNSNFSLWRSLSEVNLSVKSKDPRMNGKSLLLEDLEPEVDKEGQCLGLEKEETESSDDNTTQYSIHPPFEFPYFLLLQGYSYRQDFVIYLMSEMTHVFGRCSEHSTGEDEERLKVDILLSAPDILPRHCSVRQLESSSHCKATKKTVTLVKPLHGAFVTHNGIPVKEETQLQTGDLLGLGDFYLFMYKDPTAPTAGQRPSWLTTPMTHLGGTATCKMCGSSLLGEVARKMKPSHRKSVHRLKDSNGTDLSLTYDSIHEDQLLSKVINMTDPKGDEPKLSPAFLLCLCIQHSADYFELSDFRRLLLKIASQVQTVMWEKTKELAGIQPETVKQDPDELSLLSIKELIPGLQPLAFWMSNSIELLHFIQQEVPKLLLWGEEGGEIADSQVSATRSASEEAMTVLEEVIMFTFQQSVYYLTKTLYTALPGLLDSNPFSESGQLRVPDGVNHILEILKETLQLLNQYEVHSEIASQLFAYLFFFTNASLFNALMERGSGGGFYQWSRGVQIRANLDLLLDWIQGIGLGDLALDFFHKLSTAVNLLATPKQNLLQASWLSLRSEFASLNPAQLHHMLREYNPGRPCPAGWSPTPEEAEPAMRMADILESFDNHPPLILPCSSFHIELGRPVHDLRLPSQLSRIREFLCSLKQSSPVPSQQEVPLAAESVTSACCTSSMKNTGPLQDSDTPKDRESDVKDSSLCGRFLLPGPSDLSSCGDVLTQKLKNLELQNSLPGQNDLTSHKRLALDPSCLLTPPNTPQTLELAEADTDLLERPFRHFLNGSHKGGDDKDLATPKVKGVLSPSPEPGTQNKPGEEDEVFTVELERGPHGLGLALVDGLKTPLKMSGIYIKSLVPHSPAARSKKLGLGDRILAINGTSLAGVDYNTGRDLIRSSGDKLRLLVAKSEAQALTTKIPVTKC
ncbi:ras-associating and dilute domain-containing protein-like [Huso huso]|uniref:Ras-associating and dilute domain-containing protein-like n=1 Tax=Huso huso TaxID=61971 RepID=A0ABR0Z5V1_HUSHU